MQQGVSSVMKTLNKLFWKKSDSLRIIAAAIGTGIGIFVLLISVQFASVITNVFSQSRGKGEALYLVMSKNVSLFSNTLGNSANTFTEREIEQIKNEDFALDAGSVISNSFQLLARIEVPGAALSTEMFFEAVPDRFLDIIPDSWQWEPGDPHVPILLSREFLALYNFGYSPASGMPPLTEGAIGLVPVYIYLGYPSEDRKFTARIAGFTDRYSSILVPFSFLEWANSNYGSGNSDPSRIVVKADPKADKVIRQYLFDHGLQTNQDRLKIGEIASALFAGSLIISVFGAAILFMSLMLLAVTIQSALTQNRGQLLLLLQLGYNRKQLVKDISPGILAIIGSALVLFSIGGIILNLVLQKMIGTYIEGISISVAWPVILLIIAFIAGIPGLIIGLIYRELKKTEK